tara:strand:+ start:69877 stop:73161 length:3285 start_codon:yes stop_codon:yes gene_type:complete
MPRRHHTPKPKPAALADSLAAFIARQSGGGVVDVPSHRANLTQQYLAQSHEATPAHFESVSAWWQKFTCGYKQGATYQEVFSIYIYTAALALWWLLSRDEADADTGYISVDSIVAFTQLRCEVLLRDKVQAAPLLAGVSASLDVLVQQLSTARVREKFSSYIIDVCISDAFMTRKDPLDCFKAFDDQHVAMFSHEYYMYRLDATTDIKAETALAKAVDKLDSEVNQQLGERIKQQFAERTCYASAGKASDLVVNVSQLPWWHIAYIPFQVPGLSSQLSRLPTITERQRWVEGVEAKQKATMTFSQGLEHHILRLYALRTVVACAEIDGGCLPCLGAVPEVGLLNDSAIASSVGSGDETSSLDGSTATSGIDTNSIISTRTTPTVSAASSRRGSLSNGFTTSADESHPSQFFDAEEEPESAFFDTVSGELPDDATDNSALLKIALELQNKVDQETMINIVFNVDPSTLKQVRYQVVFYVCCITLLRDSPNYLQALKSPQYVKTVSQVYCDALQQLDFGVPEALALIDSVAFNNVYSTVYQKEILPAFVRFMWRIKATKKIKNLSYPHLHSASAAQAYQSGHYGQAHRLLALQSGMAFDGALQHLHQLIKNVIATGHDLDGALLLSASVLCQRFPAATVDVVGLLYEPALLNVYSETQIMQFKKYLPHGYRSKVVVQFFYFSFVQVGLASLFHILTRDNNLLAHSDFIVGALDRAAKRQVKRSGVRDVQMTLLRQIKTQPRQGEIIVRLADILGFSNWQAQVGLSGVLTQAFSSSEVVVVSDSGVLPYHEISSLLSQMGSCGYEVWMTGSYVTGLLSPDTLPLCIAEYCKLGRDIDFCINKGLTPEIKSVIKQWAEHELGLPCVAWSKNVEGEYKTEALYLRSQDRQTKLKLDFTEYSKFDAEALKQNILSRDLRLSGCMLKGDGTLYKIKGLDDDIRDKCICIIGKLEDKLTIDPIRVLRAIRVSVTYGYRLELRLINFLQNNHIDFYQDDNLICRLRSEIMKNYRHKQAGTIYQQWMRYNLLEKIIGVAGVNSSKALSVFTNGNVDDKKADMANIARNLLSQVYPSFNPYDESMTGLSHNHKILMRGIPVVTDT